MSETLKKVFVTTYANEYKERYPNIGLTELTYEALSAWIHVGKLLTADMDYLLPGWENLEEKKLKLAVHSDDRIYDRISAYVEVGINVS